GNRRREQLRLVHHHQHRVPVVAGDLEQPRLVRARSQVCAQLVQLVERCEAWYRRFNTAEAEGEVKAANFARLIYKENLELIVAMGQRTKPYAGTVRSLIKQEVAAGREWLGAIVWI
ncbi:hypothetical protein NKJ74_32460, partial [Mesorhizobium sp. M0046]|uniref:hypothetical protein n=1 Tax=Mesorhizobium sp. M0046 TaxID=2956858 RepID=UPI00333B2B92